MNFNQPLFGNLVKPSDLVDPGDKAFEKSLLRVSIKDGILEDHLSDIGFGQHLRNPESNGGVKSMRFEDLPPAKGLAEKKRVERTGRSRRSNEGLIAEIENLMVKGKRQNDIARILGIPYSQAAYYVRKLSDKVSVDSEVGSEPIPELMPEVEQEVAPEFKSESAKIKPAEPEPVPETSVTVERKTKIDLNTLREKWTEINVRDQVLVQLSQRVLNLLDELESKFGDIPVLETLANQSVAVLEEHYQQIAGERVGE
jgi:hypothetical protein